MAMLYRSGLRTQLPEGRASAVMQTTLTVNGGGTSRVAGTWLVV